LMASPPSLQASRQRKRYIGNVCFYPLLKRSWADWR
jgi:hypothetical protein